MYDCIYIYIYYVTASCRVYVHTCVAHERINLCMYVCVYYTLTYHGTCGAHTYMTCGIDL